MSAPIFLSVNIDHVATLRQARKAPYPSPLAAARLAIEAGANGITVHLREDRRHIQDDDLTGLCRELEVPINLEIAATERMVRIAREAKPAQVTLVPERPDEVTTEGGLDLVDHESRIQRVAATLREDDITVSLFLDPDPQQIECVARIDGSNRIEINTDAFTRAALAGLDSDGAQQELELVREGATLATAAGHTVDAGHGLTVQNVVPIAAIPEMVELNIGHSIVSRAVLVGMHKAVEEMRQAIDGARAA